MFIFIATHSPTHSFWLQVIHSHARPYTLVFNNIVCDCRKKIEG